MSQTGAEGTSEKNLDQSEKSKKLFEAFS